MGLRRHGAPTKIRGEGRGAAPTEQSGNTGAFLNSNRVWGAHSTIVIIRNPQNRKGNYPHYNIPEYPLKPIPVEPLSL